MKKEYLKPTADITVFTADKNDIIAHDILSNEDIFLTTNSTPPFKTYTFARLRHVIRSFAYFSPY